MDRLRDLPFPVRVAQGSGGECLQVVLGDHGTGSVGLEMGDVTLQFHAFVIGAEGIRTDSDGDYLEGEVDFDAVVDGVPHRGLVAKVKQAAGSSFAEALEVEWPERFTGRFAYGAFRDCVDQYVRRQVPERVLGAHRRPDRTIRIAHPRMPVEAACDLVFPR